MKFKAKIVYIANSSAPKTKKSVPFGKPFDIIVETLSGPKRRLCLKINLRPIETFVGFGLHVGQEQRLDFEPNYKQYICRITPAYSRYLSKKYRRKFSDRSKVQSHYEKEIFEASVVHCPQHILKHY